KRVLAAKYWLGLNQYRPVGTNNLIADLNTPASQSLVQRLADAAVTALKSDKDIKSFQKNVPTAIVSVGIPKFQDFETGLDIQLNNRKEYIITGKETAEELKELLKTIRRSKQIVLAIHDNRSRP